MNDDYLWDRSGEPDPEIQQLEEILGTLRFQPRPLEIPANVRPGRWRTLYPVLAIAATIVLTIIAAGLWFSFHQRQPTRPIEARNGQVEQGQKAPVQSGGAQDQKGGPTVTRKETAGGEPNRPESRRTLTTQTVHRSPKPPERQPELTATERAQKEQLIEALRLVSAKLNIAQRRAQGAPATNLIRNQHPMG